MCLDGVIDSDPFAVSIFGGASSYQPPAHEVELHGRQHRAGGRLVGYGKATLGPLRKLRYIS